MLLKTKLLLSLGTLGVVAGTSSGVYYLKNKDVSSQQSEQQQQGSVEAAAVVDRNLPKQSTDDNPASPKPPLKQEAEAPTV